MTRDLMLDVSSAHVWLFVNNHLGCRMKELMDDFLSSWILIASFLESDYLGVSLKVKIEWEWMLDVSSVQNWSFVS